MAGAIPWRLVAAALAGAAMHCSLDGCVTCTPNATIDSICQQGCIDARDACVSTGAPVNEGAECFASTTARGTCDGGICDVQTLR
jgi:hypothetical protein